LGHRSIFVFAAMTVIAATVTFAPATTAGAKKARHGRQDITKIDHIVVLMQENRSFDHYFGLLHEEGQPRSTREPRRGNPNPLNPHEKIRPFLQPNLCEVADLAHGWDATHREINGGKMNGFTAENVDPADPTGSRTMGRYDKGALPFYYALANEFAIADRYFASVPGPTFPNRFYLLAGSSFGHISNDFPPAGGYPQKTIFGSLEAAHVSWKIYLSSAQVELLFAEITKHSDHVVPLSQYYTDAAHGTLPQVSFVESQPFGSGENDEHPPSNPQLGQRFTHDLITALAASPNWGSSAFFLVYDEHGGYYDHVKPPNAVPPDDIPPNGRPGQAFDRYGVRVPALVISPWARPHSVSHTVYDHTSVLKFIETRFGLPALTRRDAAADPMLRMFDFSHMSIPHPHLPSAPIDPADVAQCTAVNG
jgi:phospholipase C